MKADALFILWCLRLLALRFVNPLRAEFEYREMKLGLLRIRETRRHSEHLALAENETFFRITRKGIEEIESGNL